MVYGDESTTTRPEIRSGMVVYTAEGEHLGIVEKRDDDSITVETGRYFRRSVTVAYDEIANVDGERVILRPDPAPEADPARKSAEDPPTPPASTRKAKKDVARPVPPAAPKPQSRALGPLPERTTRLPLRGAAPERMLPKPPAPGAAKETAVETARQPWPQRYRTEGLFLSTLVLGLLLGFASGVLYGWRRPPRRRSVYRRFFT